MLTPEPRHAAPPKQVLPYPAGLSRLILRAPLLMHRLGLGGFLSRFRLVVLTTRGRKSGLPRHTPVEYRMHGTKIYLISAWGERPHWVKNLIAHPYATIQAGPRSYGATAKLVNEPSEALRAFFLFRKPAPAVYDALLARLTEAETVEARRLPELASQLTVIRLDIVDGGDGLNGLKSDLRWVLPVALVGLIGVMALARYWRSENEERGWA